jgi:hypothetical protein
MQDVGSQVTFKRPRNWGYLIKRPSGQQSVNKVRAFMDVTPWSRVDRYCTNNSEESVA